jgi:hypothetical protein
MILSFFFMKNIHISKDFTMIESLFSCRKIAKMTEI